MNSGLDPIIHQQTRLSILASLTEVAAASFTHLRDSLDLSDGNLSRHLTVLSDAGYVDITKTFKGNMPHTRVSVTDSGIVAFENYLTTLQAMIDTVQGRGTPSRASGSDEPLAAVTARRDKKGNHVRSSRNRA